MKTAVPGETAYARKYRNAYRRGFRAGYEGQKFWTDVYRNVQLQVYWAAGWRQGNENRIYDRQAGKPSVLSRRIVAIIVREGVRWPGGADNAFISRLRPGWKQQTRGCWTWRLMPVQLGALTINDYPKVGSQFRAKNFLACAGELEFEDEFIHVLDERPMRVSFPYARPQA